MHSGIPFHCLSWKIQRGIAAIPKSVTKKRIEENFDVFNFELTEEDVGLLRTFDKGFRGRKFPETV